MPWLARGHSRTLTLFLASAGAGLAAASAEAALEPASQGDGELLTEPCPAQTPGRCGACGTCCFGKTQVECWHCLVQECGFGKPQKPTVPEGAWFSGAGSSMDTMTTGDAVLLYLALVPALCRLVFDWLLGLLRTELRRCHRQVSRHGIRSCCRKRINDEHYAASSVELLESAALDVDGVGSSREAHLLPSTGAIKWEEASVLIPSWEEARLRNQQSPLHAFALAGFRLLCFHLLQPMVYVTAYTVYWQVLDLPLRALGAVVLLREAMYFTMMVRFAFRMPAFLLIDVAASASDGNYLFILSYVLSPERAILPFFYPSQDKPVWLVCDFCSCLALIIGHHRGSVLPPGLAAGYGLTTAFTMMWLAFWCLILVVSVVSVLCYSIVVRVSRRRQEARSWRVSS